MPKSSPHLSSTANLSILSHKLFYAIVAGFFAVMLLVALSLGSSFQALMSVEGLVTGIVESNSKKMEFVHNISQKARERITALHQISNVTNAADRQKMISDTKHLWQPLVLNVQAFDGQAVSTDESLVLKKLKSELNEFNTVQRKVLDLLIDNKNKEAVSILLYFEKEHDELHQVLMRYSELEKGLGNASSDEIKAVFSDSLKWMGIISVAVIILALLVLFSVVHFVTKQQKKITDMNNMLDSYNQLLKMSVNEAENANDAKSEFIANVNHELRTPMTTIKGALGILSSGMIDNVPDEAQGLISMADKNIDDLIVLMNDVLSFSQFEEEGIDIVKREFSIHREVETFLIPFYKQARNKAINLKATFSNRVPVIVKLDQAHLFQILNQLINNAIKFTSEGDVLLKIDYKEETDEIIFHVVDTGIGLDEKDIHYIFKSFVQVDGSSTRKYGGTGIGLAICKKLVDALEGEIEVSSEKEKGSTFSITIPVEIAA